MFSTSRSLALPLLLMLLLTAGAAVAQPGAAEGPGQRRHEKIEAARVAFLTNRLNLTTEQAQKFWPVYNEYDARRRAVRRRIAGHKRDLATLADNQLQGAIDNLFAARQEELNLDKEYAARFQKVISTRQTLLLYRSEREFTKLLLRRLEERRGGPAGQPADAGDGDDE